MNESLVDYFTFCFALNTGLSFSGIWDKLKGKLTNIKEEETAKKYVLILGQGINDQQYTSKLEKAEVFWEKNSNIWASCIAKSAIIGTILSLLGIVFNEFSCVKGLHSISLLLLFPFVQYNIGIFIFPFSIRLSLKRISYPWLHLQMKERKLMKLRGECDKIEKDILNNLAKLQLPSSSNNSIK